jgi:osmoprotectant transport system ATP-binding protein
LIELEDVTKTFRDPEGKEVVAVGGVSLTVAEGETVALIGTSGCGKTTTMKLVNRLIEPTSGHIKVEGKDVADWDVIKLRRSIGYVIQKGGLFPHHTIASNVGLLCKLEGWPAPKTESRVDELLSLVNLEPEKYASRYPRELSGGQRQRVGVARALALDPPVILMDEPFGALDPITRDQIHDEFLQLKQRVKKTILFVTHDMAEAFKLAERVVLMDAGKIIQVGTEEDYRERPANQFVADFLKSHMHGAAHA